MYNNEIVFKFNPCKIYSIEDNFKIHCNIQSGVDKERKIEVSIDNKNLKTIKKFTKEFDICLLDLFKTISVGEHSINIAVYENDKVIGRLYYPSVQFVTPEEITISERNECPYLSTYYIEPILEINKPWQVEVNIDDYYGSYYKEFDLDKKYKIHIKVDDKEDRVIENLSGGNHFIDMPAFSEYGQYEFCLYCEDERGIYSHELWNEVWVKPPMEEKVYEMTEQDLIDYNIVNKCFENIVAVPFSQEEYDELMAVTDTILRCDKRDEILNNKEEVLNYQIPSGEYALFFPDFDNDGEYDRYSGWMYREQFIRYADDYNEEELNNIALNNRLGLQQFLDDKIAEGYTTVKLIKDSYFLVEKRDKLEGEGHGSGSAIYIEADNFTLDMNNAKIKLNKHNLDSSQILGIHFSFNTHVINGHFEGDAFTHVYDNSAEWNNGMGIHGGCKYCSIQNCTLEHDSGYGYVGGGVSVNRSGSKGYTTGLQGIGKFTNGDLDSNGNWVEASDRCVTDFVNITEFINEYKSYYGDVEQVKGQISIYLGYQGNGMHAWNLKVFTYDENKNFLEEHTGYQYREMKFHKDTKFIRVVGFAPEEYVGTNLNLVHFTRPINCVSKDITIKEIRGTGGAWTGSNNCLFENINIYNAGNHVTPVAFDFEDGWDQMQDVTIRNMNAYECFKSDSLTVTAGHNFILEDTDCISTAFWKRSRNAKIRNCNINRFSIEYTDIRKTGSYKIYNVTAKEIATQSNNYVKDVKINSHPSGYVKNGEFTSLSLLSGDTFYIQDSIVNLPAENGWSGYLSKGHKVKNCIIDTEFERIDLAFNNAYPYPEFYDCIFKKRVCLRHNHGYRGSYIENCVFEDGLYMQPSVLEYDEGTKHIHFRNCILEIKDPSNSFIRNCPYVYSIGDVYITFENCTFNIHETAKSYFIEDGSTSERGTIEFINCTFNSLKDMIFFYPHILYGDQGIYENLTFKLINTKLPDNFSTEEALAREGIHILEINEDEPVSNIRNFNNVYVNGKKIIIYYKGKRIN